jgi:hypothetical protein
MGPFARRVITSKTNEEWFYLTYYPIWKIPGIRGVAGEYVDLWLPNGYYWSMPGPDDISLK